MSSSKDRLIQFFQNADIQRILQEMIRPLGLLLYDHLYLYIWFICIYNVILIFLVMVILVLLWNGNRIRSVPIPIL